MKQTLLPNRLPWMAGEIDDEVGRDAVCTLRRVFGNAPFCSRPAAFACRLGCCGHVKVVCQAHRNIPEAIYPKTFICTRCRTSDPSIVATWPI